MYVSTYSSFYVFISEWSETVAIKKNVTKTQI